MERNQESHNRAWYDRSVAVEPAAYGSLARRGEGPNFDFNRNSKNNEDRIRYLVLLRRYRVAVATIFATCLVASAIYSLVASKVYKSQTVLEVMTINQDFMNNKNVDPNSQMSSSDTYLDTQSKLLLSGPVLDKTVALLAPTGSFLAHEQTCFFGSRARLVWPFGNGSPGSGRYCPEHVGSHQG